MLRILFAAASLTLCAPAALACNGQTGDVIFEDNFLRYSGVLFADNEWIPELLAPAVEVPMSKGAALEVPASKNGAWQREVNRTHEIEKADFCVEMTFPSHAAQLDAEIGVLFMSDGNYDNYGGLISRPSKFWLAKVNANGRVGLYKVDGYEWLTVWETTTRDLVNTGPTSMNSVRVVVKYWIITVIVNGQTVKESQNLLMPGQAGPYFFGFYGGYGKPSATPVLFPVHSYKVTALE
jgi:hypothetical protein